jgi:hypothetical protein
MQLVFQEKHMSRVWRKTKRDVSVGVVMYMMEKDDDDEFSRMGIVDSVKPGKDGHVQYTNPGGNPQTRLPPQLAMRPIHKLAVKVPTDYCH